LGIYLKGEDGKKDLNLHQLRLAKKAIIDLALVREVLHTREQADSVGRSGCLTKRWQQLHMDVVDVVDVTAMPDRTRPDHGAMWFLTMKALEWTVGVIPSPVS
jgi:hypothetical protein